MKKILSLAIFALFISGCNNLGLNNQNKTNNTNNTVNEIEQLKQDILKDFSLEKPVALEGEGTACGGNEGTTCTIPLFCVFEDNSPTGTGTCQNLIHYKNLDCNELLFKQEKSNQEPVCATIGNQKYTFQNLCEAVRRGAQSTEKGFCKPKETSQNNCKAKASGLGMCFSTTEAWEFDGNNCIQRFVTGCDHEIPFATKTQCEQKCN